MFERCNIEGWVCLELQENCENRNIVRNTSKLGKRTSSKMTHPLKLANLGINDTVLILQLAAVKCKCLSILFWTQDIWGKKFIGL